MHTKTIEQFAELMNCESVETWRDLIFRLGGNIGYEKTLLAILPNPSAPAEAEFAFIHSNYSSTWRDKYDAEQMQHVDPTFTHCISKSTPLIWTPEIFSLRKQKEMYEEACAHGLCSGVTLPIHGPHGEMGILCFVNSDRPGKTFQRDTCRVIPELSYFRDVIFETSLAFIKSPHSPSIPPAVTPREMECIIWCAAGKSSWDIAQILNCSEAAVNFHFSNLRRKFGVKSRQQVVVKAMRYGLINP